MAWVLLTGPFDNPNKHLVDSGIVGQLRMKSGREQAILPDRNGAAVVQARHHPHALADLLHGRSPDEHPVKRGPFELLDGQILLKAVD